MKMNFGLNVNLEQLKAHIIIKLNKKTILSPEGCWLFPVTEGDGYSRTAIGKRNYSVHKLSAWIYLEDYFEKADNDAIICHRRSCPNRNCWNPEHLYIGDAKSNAEDTIKCNRNFNQCKTRCKFGHIFTLENTIIYVNEKTKWNQRKCKICSKNRDITRWENRRKNRKTNMDFLNG